MMIIKSYIIDEVITECDMYHIVFVVSDSTSQPQSRRNNCSALHFLHVATTQVLERLSTSEYWYDIW